MNLSFENVDAFCASVDLSQERPLVDLSRLNFIEPFAVIYIGQFLRCHNRLNRYFDVALPKAKTPVRKYLARIRFWERFKFTRDMVEREGMLRFTSDTSLNDIVELVPTRYVGDDTATLVESVLSRGRIRVDGEAVLEAVAELADNFAQHARVELASLAVQYCPALSELAVAIGDSGLGMRETLCENSKFAYLKYRSHTEAILQAFEPLVSRRPQSGTGLTNVRDRVLQSGGNIRVASNDGFVYISQRGPVKMKQKYDLPGVQIEVRFPKRG